MSHQESASSTRATMLHLLVGGISGSIAKSSVAPLDRVKILYQVFLAAAFFFVLSHTRGGIATDSLQGVSL